MAEIKIFGINIFPDGRMSASFDDNKGGKRIIHTSPENLSRQVALRMKKGDALSFRGKLETETIVSFVNGIEGTREERRKSGIVFRKG